MDIVDLAVKAVTQALKDHLDTPEYQDTLARAVSRVIQESQVLVATRELQVIVDSRVIVVNPDSQATREVQDSADILVSLDILEFKE